MIRARASRTKISAPFCSFTNKFIFFTVANLNSLKCCLNDPFFIPLPCSKIFNSSMFCSVKSGCDTLAQSSLNQSWCLISPCPSHPRTVPSGRTAASGSQTSPTVHLPVLRNCLPWGGTHSLPYLADILTPLVIPICPSRSSSKEREKNKKIQKLYFHPGSQSQFWNGHWLCHFILICIKYSKH